MQRIDIDGYTVTLERIGGLDPWRISIYMPDGQLHTFGCFADAQVAIEWARRNLEDLGVTFVQS